MITNFPTTPNINFATKISRFVETLGLQEVEIGEVPQCKLHLSSLLNILSKYFVKFMSSNIASPCDICDEFKSTLGEIAKNYLVINNIAKKPNILSLYGAAVAMNFVPIIVGAPIIGDLIVEKNNTGNQVELLRFDKIEECKNFLISKSVRLVGIEIMPQAKSILNDPFQEGVCVAFMPGNEGDGLSNRQKEMCDEYVYIPQRGNGTASLNVTVATTLVLHEHYRWSHRVSM